MFGFRYLKAAPTDFVRHYVRGKLAKEGTGLSFLYYAPLSTLVKVPTASADAPFVIHETTADFQTVTLQGHVSYAVADPRKAAAQLDFHLDAAGAWATEDPALLSRRLVQEITVIAKRQVGKMALREALGAAVRLQDEVLQGLRGAESMTRLGVEVLGLALLEIKPTPEMARALEAEAREGLQRRADEAVYQRRNAAVEQERVIKENELNTEIAVEQKQRAIREAKMEAEIAVEEKKRKVRETQIAADIAVEEQRKRLIEERTGNERKEADARGYALEAVFTPLKGVDWKLLLAAGGGALDPRLMIALAFRELAENAGKIGELNVSPDLLQSLIGKGK
jgi:hypothetical protein